MAGQRNLQRSWHAFCRLGQLRYRESQLQNYGQREQVHSYGSRSLRRLSGQLTNFEYVFENLALIVCCLAVNGRGVNMLKVGTKRRRTKAEMEDFALEAIQKEDEDREIRRRLGLLE